jgi:hypothetical protein
LVPVEAAQWKGRTVERWGLEIFGSEAAISRFASALPEGMSLVEETGLYVLLNESWQGPGKWEDVEGTGRELVKAATGLMRLRDRRDEGVTAGAVVRLNEDGFWDHYVHITGEVRVAQLAVELLVKSPTETPAPPEDPLPDWLDVVSVDSSVRRIVGQFGVAEDWEDLYKVYELVRSALGGQPAVHAIIGRDLRSRFTETAQHYRHAEHPLPDNPLRFDEAREVIAGLIEELLSRFLPSG